MAIVYQHRRKDTNEVFYIGIGSEIKRAYNKKDRGEHWKRIVRKHGYEVDVLVEGISWEDACLVEIEMIKKIGRSDKGLGSLINKTDGGEGTLGLSRPDVSDRLSKQVGDLNPMYGRKGELHPMYGKKNLLVSQKKLGVKRPDVSLKNSLKKGQPNGRVKELHPMWGKKGELSARSKPVIDVESEREFCSVTDAASYLGIKQSSVYYHIKKGKFKYL